MNPRVSELLDRIKQIENEIEVELQRRRVELHANFAHRRIRFESEVIEQQRHFKTGILKYLLNAELRNVASAPFIYAVLLPLLALDLAVFIYQYICFPLYGIARVRRREHLLFDRSHLAYLNLIEKINCAYCAYASGLISYVKEVIGRTEQYWCPIKHARRIHHAHANYRDFVDFGDAEGYRRELQSLRAALAQIDADDAR
jgi:hypothetical protein